MKAPFLLTAAVLAPLALPTLRAEPAPTATWHYWNFDDETDPFRDLIGQAHGVVTEETTVERVSGRLEGGGALATRSQVTGPDDFLAIDGGLLFRPGERAFSVSLWFRMPEPVTANRGIFDFSGSGLDGPQMLLTAAKSLNFRIDGLGAYNLVAAIPDAQVEDGEWHFFAAVYDPELEEQTLKVYLDSSEVTASASRGSTLPTAVESPPSNYIGTFNFTGASEAKGLAGEVDDLAYYSGVLTPAQIAALRAGDLSPLDLRREERVIPIRSFTYDPETGQSLLTWPTTDGSTYHVWGSSNLVNWLQLSFFPIPGTGEDEEFIDFPFGEPNYFYQVREE